jgi:dihydropyrimidinase
LKGQKDLGREVFTKIPNGAPGVENRMALLYDGGVVKRGWSVNRFVEVTSTAAAKRFGLFPKKGTIAVGSDADIVVWDPEKRVKISAAIPETHHMNVDYSTYEGFEVRGYAETVLSRGRVVVEKGTQRTERGGRFIKRATVGSLLR